MFETKPIPSGKTKKWDLSLLVLESAFGTLSVRLRPEGFGSWDFAEVGGGGAVTLLTSHTPQGELLIGMVSEKRANMGDDPVWCIPGGFVEIGESHQAAQAREAKEEVGVETAQAVRLTGLPFNPNRAFFVADPTKDEGTKAFMLEVPFSWLQVDPKGRIWRFREAEDVPVIKRASDVAFFRWYEADQYTADGLGLAAAYQALAYLARQEANRLPR